MKCIFCGKANEDSDTRCKYCGYIFGDNYAIESNTDALGETSQEQIFSQNVQPNVAEEYNPLEVITKQRISENTLFDKWKKIVTSQEGMYEDKTIDPSKPSKQDTIEIIVSIVLYVIVLIVAAYGRITSDSWKVLFEPLYMVVIGFVGIIAFILCGLFEGAIPDSLGGIIIRTSFLIILWEFPNIVTFLLYIGVIAISISFLRSTYFDRIPAIVLGSVSIICLPFLGVFIAVIVGLFFREMSGGKKNKSKHR